VGQLRYTVFKLGDEELAIDSSKIQSSAIYTGKKQKLSGVDKFILGKDDAGNILVDLNLFLNFPLKDLKAILYTSIIGKQIGLVVNAKLDEISIDDAKISPTPEAVLAKYKTHFIVGIAKVDDRLIIVIDPSKVFSDSDIEKIAIASTKSPKVPFFQSLKEKFSHHKDTPVIAPQASPQTNTVNTQKIQVNSQSSTQTEVPIQQSQNQQQPQVVQQSISQPQTQNNAQQAQQTQTAPQPQIIQSQEQVAHVESGQIIVEDAIKDEHSKIIPENIINSIQQLKTDLSNNQTQNISVKKEESVDAFFGKLKEDPFVKHQEEVKENLRKIKTSIEQLDTFFDDLLTDEETNTSSYDASEEVLLSSIGMDLDKPVGFFAEKPVVAKEKVQKVKQVKEQVKQTKEPLKEVLKEAVKEVPKEPIKEEQKMSEDEKRKRAEEKKRMVDPSKSFGFKDGKSIFNIEQLIEELKVMNDDEFTSHVNDSKNDFANWTKYAIILPNIADMIQNIKAKQDMINTLEIYFAQS
jgi:purine-binding chemotaxis protein CheW